MQALPGAGSKDCGPLCVIKNENDHRVLHESYGDSISSEVQLAALRHLGLKAEFRTDGCLLALRDEIDAGRPLDVGWWHHEPERPRVAVATGPW